jgi:pimeloyl-ACP methyl ester carboxylesterase
MCDVRFVEIPSSPLAPGVTPVRIRYRDAGRGMPVVVLHGGWGYEIYPFDRQVAALSAGCRVVIPDRSGYGGSPRIDDFPPDFHARAAQETCAVIDVLGVSRPILWGHSDGAIVALMIALSDPGRITGAIVEATHFYKWKPGSRAFFEAIVANPESLGARASAVMASDHGAGWRQIVDRHSRAWLRIANDAQSPTEDFYGGRLGDLKVPILVVHGAKDPRTEPGELEALSATLSRPGRTRAAGPAEDHVSRWFAIFEDGGHSPHTERAIADAVTDAALRFVRDVIGAATAHPADPGEPADPARPLRP